MFRLAPTFLRSAQRILRSAPTFVRFVETILRLTPIFLRSGPSERSGGRSVARFAWSRSRSLSVEGGLLLHMRKSHGSEERVIATEPGLGEYVGHSRHSARRFLPIEPRRVPMRPRLATRAGKAARAEPRSPAMLAWSAHDRGSRARKKSPVFRAVRINRHVRGRFLVIRRRISKRRGNVSVKGATKRAASSAVINVRLRRPPLDQMPESMF
jgi:hypothetical protein